MNNLNSLFRSVQEQVEAALRPAIPDNTTEPVQMLAPRALVVVFNPILDPATSKRLLQAPEAAKYSQVDALLAGYIADVAECSGGQVKYSVVERLTRD